MHSVLLAALVASVSACTTLGAGKGATADGSTLCSHSDDGEATPDSRVVRVPARDHAPGSVRKIWWDKEDYPRYVGYDRSPTYYPTSKSQKLSQPIGYIAEVNHTFAYFEGNYAIMNEHQVGIAESTCSGVFGTDSTRFGGKAIMSIDELSRIALERCTSARDAVQTMGALAVEFGFYGAGKFEGSAESLFVSDPNEVFVFQILPDDTNASAVWAAQRVPDGHVAVVANMFTIRGVNTSDAQNFYASPNLHSIAKKFGWWKESDGLLDFTKVYSDGEYAHKYYSGRRMWGAYGLLAPDTKLNASYGDLRYDAYPFSLPAKNIRPQDLMRTHRYYYQNTSYDMTKGLAAGPFADPDRYKTVSDLPGNWERSIGLYRTSYSHVAQARAPSKTGENPDQTGIIWFGPHSAPGTCYIPFSSNASAVPVPLTFADPARVDRASLWWANKWIYNLAHLRYDGMMGIVNAAQVALETRGEELVKMLDRSPTANVTAAYQNHAAAVLKTWWELPDQMMLAFADGWVNEKAPTVGSTYPDSWLKGVGWNEGPGPPPPEPENFPHGREL